VLARSLALDRDDPEGAIQAYAARRRERTAAIQTASRDQSRMVRLTDPSEMAARNERLATGPDAYVARWEWIYGYDVDGATADGEAQRLWILPAYTFDLGQAR
jgi:hypothetical protein